MKLMFLIHLTPDPSAVKQRFEWCDIIIETTIMWMSERGGYVACMILE